MKNVIIHISQTSVRGILQGKSDDPFKDVTSYIEVPLKPSALESDTVLQYDELRNAIEKLIGFVRNSDYKNNLQSARVCIDSSVHFNIHHEKTKEPNGSNEITKATINTLRKNITDFKYLDKGYTSISYSVIDYKIFEEGKFAPLVKLEGKQHSDSEDANPERLEGTRGSRIEASVNSIQIKTDYLRSVVQALRDNSIEPIITEPSVVSIFRLFHEKMEGSSNMLLYIGERVSQILISNNFRIFSIQSLNFGIDSLIQKVSEKLDVKIATIRDFFLSTDNDRNKTLIMGSKEINYSSLRSRVSMICIDYLREVLEPFAEKYLTKEGDLPFLKEIKHFSFLCHQESKFINNTMHAVTQSINMTCDLNLTEQNLYEGIPSEFLDASSKYKTANPNKKPFLYAMIGCHQSESKESVYLFHRDHTEDLASGIQKKSEENNHNIYDYDTVHEKTSTIESDMVSEPENRKKGAGFSLKGAFKKGGDLLGNFFQPVEDEDDSEY